ncbi:chorismate-binding protein [Capnocytophaga canimorsus]|uniref:chorismate-binding protein n=1 Tax=Capnocytophaga canimorsus TaxID=28188 RepID=UPI001EDFFA5D|nr:chorismate-binding protein [Capnocytophaga canimorsus]GJQ05369.1 hypothetical protein CAPN009_17840 [Capnocytophaga canimorsus]
MEKNTLQYNEIIGKATELLEKEIPFVIFKNPNSMQIQLIHQEDNQLFYFNDSFSVEGFVLAPFDKEKPTIFLPAEYAFEAQIESIDVPTATNENLSNDEEETFRYKKMVEQTIETIQNGVIEKVVLSREISILQEGNPLSSFERMIQKYADAFCYLFFHPEVGTWLAATPEILLKIKGNQITTMALAGTQPYVEQKDIIWKEKEKQEQQIVTDVIVDKIQESVNQLQVSDPQTVRAGSVVHLCSHIEATLKEEQDVFSVVNQLHPTPAVCGFPYEKAFEYIAQNEGYDREFYTGYCGMISNIAENILDFYVNLRCMKITAEHISVYVGGGIVSQSDPESEWQETQNKARTMLSVI